MQARHSRIFTILLAAVLVAFGANLAAYAADGGPLLIGKSNTATKTTKLKNSKGTALQLKSKKGTAPLKVNSSTTVKKLSADLVDGQDSSALRNQTFVYNLFGSSTATDTAWALPGLPPGKYLASYSMVLGFTAPPSLVACYFSPATGSISRWTGIMVGVPSTSSYVSGSGYIDTTADPFVLGCEQSGGGTMTSSVPPLGPSKVVLTRVDDVVTGTSPGPVPLTPIPKPGGKPSLR